MVFSLLKYFVMSLQNNIPCPAKLVTLEDVKNCVAFPKESVTHKCLISICEARYKIAKLTGASEKDAVKSAADALADALNKMRI